MIQITRYRQLQESGITPEELYAIAKNDLGDTPRLLWLIRNVFGLSLSEAREVVRKGNDVYFQQYVLPPYITMRKAMDECAFIHALKSDETIGDIERVKILMAVSRTSLASAKRKLLSQNS